MEGIKGCTGGFQIFYDSDRSNWGVTIETHYSKNKTDELRSKLTEIFKDLLGEEPKKIMIHFERPGRIAEGAAKYLRCHSFKIETITHKEVENDKKILAN